LKVRLGVRGGGGGEEEGHPRSSTSAPSVIVLPTPHIEPPPVWGTTFATGTLQPQRRALVLMDTFSEYHGNFLAHRAKTVYGVAIILVFSDYMKGFFEATHTPGPELDQLLSMCMPSTSDEVDLWYRLLQDDVRDGGPCQLVGLSCESDSGLEAAERLAVLLGPRLLHHNGMNAARRHKYLMNQVVGNAGLSVVRQSLCRTVEEARAFAERELTMYPAEQDTLPSSPRRVVVKPIRGVGSDDVHLCTSIESVQEAFEKIHGSTVFGAPLDKHDSVLVQEFAVGQEYAIDMVSRNGQHKVAAIWKYDKRPANGAPFVYYATELYDGAAAASITKYASQCLSALDMKWGISHTEIIVSEDTGEPRLVEVNGRQHNMDFLPLTMSCIGYNAFDLLLAAYLGDSDSNENPIRSEYPPGTEDQRLSWDLLAEFPRNLKRRGAMVHLVNYQHGRLSHINEAALDEIQSMESVLNMEVYESFLELGQMITPTIDIRSDAGWVQLVNDDDDAFRRDYNRIIELMHIIFGVDEPMS
jgi:ATP-grasp domain